MSDYTRTKLKWNGWGWKDKTFELGNRESHFWEFVRNNLQVTTLPSSPSIAWEDINLPKPRITKTLQAQLVDILDKERVCTDAYERIFHAVGKSYRDLLRLRQGSLPGAPDVVLYPISTREVISLVELAEAKHFALIPYGGGSSVVGGVEAISGDGQKGVWTLDLSRMNELVFQTPRGLTTVAPTKNSAAVP